MPDHQKIRDHKHLRFFGGLLHDPNLWHLNRRSVAGACAVGLFAAFIPIPFQMALAAATAIPLRVNLPISASLVWITNPITMPPLSYFAYRLGAWLLDEPMMPFEFELSVDWLLSGMAHTWKPFLLGSLLMGIVSATLGYFLVRLTWRWYIVRHLRGRRSRAQLGARIKSS